MTQIDVSRRERKKDETRERIAQAAIRLFQEKSFEATTIDEIAGAADVAKGTFFNYFERKDAVLAHFAATEVEGFESLAEELVHGSGSARAGLFQIFDGGVESYERQPDLWRVTVLEMMRHKTPAIAEINERVQAAIRNLVDAGQRRGELRRDMDSNLAASVLRGIFISTTLTWLHCPDQFNLGPEMRARFELVFEGMVPERRA